VYPVKIQLTYDIANSDTILHVTYRERIKTKNKIQSDLKSSVKICIQTLLTKRGAGGASVCWELPSYLLAGFF